MIYVHIAAGFREVLDYSMYVLVGVTSSCSVGYLTHLEALRYCQAMRLSLNMHNRTLSPVLSLN